MDSIFQNYSEQIHEVFKISKKSHSQISFKIQRNQSLFIDFLNENILNSHIDCIEYIDMKLISKEGYVITGRSDKLHLNDVITRLYQSLENLLKSNKGHKVQAKIEFNENIDEQETQIESLTGEKWDINFLRKFITSIYSQLEENIKSKLNYKFSIEGYYSDTLYIYSKGDTREKNKFEIVLTCEMSPKSQPCKKSVSLIKFTVADINNQLDNKKFITNIIKESESILKQNK